MIRHRLKPAPVECNHIKIQRSLTRRHLGITCPPSLLSLRAVSGMKVQVRLLRLHDRTLDSIKDLVAERDIPGLLHSRVNEERGQRTRRRGESTRKSIYLNITKTMIRKRRCVRYRGVVRWSQWSRRSGDERVRLVRAVDTAAMAVCTSSTAPRHIRAPITVEHLGVPQHHCSVLHKRAPRQRETREAGHVITKIKNPCRRFLRCWAGGDYATAAAAELDRETFHRSCRARSLRHTEGRVVCFDRAHRFTHARRGNDAHRSRRCAGSLCGPACACDLIARRRERVAFR